MKDNIDYLSQENYPHKNSEVGFNSKESVDGKEPGDNSKDNADNEVHGDEQIVLCVEDIVFSLYFRLFKAILPVLLKIKLLLVVDRIVPSVQIVHHISYHLHFL